MAATVTYFWPVLGGTTVPPTAAQSHFLVSAIVNWLDADTQAVVTTNFGLTPTELTALFPFVARTVDPSSAGTVNALVAVTKAANTITFSKASAAGSGGTFQAMAQKWHSITR